MTQHNNLCHGEIDCPGCESDEQASALISAVRRIAYGGLEGPTGFEALCMAISGPGTAGHRDLCTSISDAGSAVAAGLSEVALSLNCIADALTDRKT